MSTAEHESPPDRRGPVRRDGPRRDRHPEPPASAKCDLGAHAAAVVERAARRRRRPGRALRAPHRRGKGFCSGLDLKDATAGTGIGSAASAVDAETIDVATLPTVILQEMDTPVLGVINGAAAGYGLDLALGCDMRLGSTSTRLLPGFAKRGVVPESGGTWYLPRLVGWSRACRIAMFGPRPRRCGVAGVRAARHRRRRRRADRHRARVGQRDRRERAAGDPGDEAPVPRGTDGRVPAAQREGSRGDDASVRDRRLPRGHHRVHGRSDPRLPRPLTARVRPPCSASRRSPRAPVFRACPSASAGHTSSRSWRRRVRTVRWAGRCRRHRARSR